MKLVIKHIATDDFNFSFELYTPIEYESPEALLVFIHDFMRRREDHLAAQEERSNEIWNWRKENPNKNWITECPIKMMPYFSPSSALESFIVDTLVHQQKDQIEILTIDEWFEKTKI